MHECLLCKRDMKTSKDTFGNGCVKNIYSFLGMSMPKKVKLREQTLYKNIMKINNIHKINTNQKIWLVDRYLTQQYLSKIPYGNYNKITNQINTEIQNINQIKNNEEPKSAKNMSLKQAYDLYKKATRFTEGMQKIKEGNFTDEESIISEKHGEKWNLDIKLHDRYDYSEFKKIDKYYKDTGSVPKSIFSSTLYNLAWYSMKFNVMKEYNIDITFKMKDFEVIDL